MGHGRTMEVTASKFEWTKFKDQLHFYLMLGLVPIGLIIGGTNLIYGPAELKDIPDGYEPKHWEYYKHPISQFIARYLLDSPEKRYERHLHFVSKEQDKWIMKLLRRVKKMQRGRKECR
ncbi:hypothetical protein HELRODRAFT_184136 [Helobdella robusta]|uniref:NADH dehydrogenase [ubiquinone] 1 beta subcomplex subunit 5, mitochondrial n=1 Tax=Helobdella robusta TaxID=6412 RepID=T1FKN3_HELRO|nr:hypothetical protein HELRODRAFT_184136 [Helobdella robusta]ESO07441.1 hypothetical protein HELRODRAFT_184136 [Helobdella robusta]